MDLIYLIIYTAFYRTQTPKCLPKPILLPASLCIMYMCIYLLHLEIYIYIFVKFLTSLFALCPLPCICTDFILICDFFAQYCFTSYIAIYYMLYDYCYVLYIIYFTLYIVICVIIYTLL